MLDNLVNTFKEFQDQIILWSVSHGIRLLMIIVIILVLNFMLKFGIKKFVQFYLSDEQEGSEKGKRVRTMARVLKIVGAILLLGTGIIMVLSEIGIDIVPVLASLGIGGLAIGFGAQSLVKDVITGFFLLFEDQMRVGDVVEAAGKSGLVEKVGLRVLVLRDFSGNRIIIPNSEITQVINMTYEYSRYAFELGVAYKEDVDKVMEVIKAVGDELRQDPVLGPDITEAIEIMGLDQFGDSAIVIKGRLTTKPIRQWAIGREFNRRIKIAFDEQGIEIPFPHTTVYMGDNQASEIAKALDK